MNLNAKLVLIPTPISENLSLEPVALALLQDRCLKNEVGILVEDHKVARQRWIQWGLPREAINRFILYNEHTQENKINELILEMKAGKQFFLMSDSGLPAFCDPGQLLVHECHSQSIGVSCTPFPNSIALALALSGFSHREFFFAGFLPAEAQERKLSLERLTRYKTTLVLMDTPYRLQVLLKDLSQSALKSRSLFLGVNLNSPEEKLYCGSMGEVIKQVGDINKVEFMMVISA